MTDPDPSQTAEPPKWKQRLKAFYKRIKSLQGDPHYVAIGMASGVFISVTPTIPFHTALAIAMAFVLKGSKPAAALGAWFCNPLTIGPFYVGSYQLGLWLLGREVDIDMGTITLKELMALGTDVAIAMMVGGALLGIVPAVASYFVTYHMFRKIRDRRRRRRAAKAENDPSIPGDTPPSLDVGTEKKHTP